MVGEYRIIRLPSMQYLKNKLGKKHIITDRPQIRGSAVHELLKEYGIYLLRKYHPDLKIKLEYNYTDVVGLSNNYNVAIECGTLALNKIEGLVQDYDFVYWIPYNLDIQPIYAYMTVIDDEFVKNGFADIPLMAQKWGVGENNIYDILISYYKKGDARRENIGTLHKPHWVFYIIDRKIRMRGL